MSLDKNTFDQAAPALSGDASWIDFAGRENPFGTPASFIEAMQAALEDGAASYQPDLRTRTLKNVLARTLSLPAESFLVGTTPAAMIGAVSQAFEPCTVGVATPCPTEYVLALSNTGHRIERISLPGAFTVAPAGSLVERGLKIDAAVLANPSYPSSRLLHQPVLESYLDTCDWVVVDERSIELTLGGKSVAELTQLRKNLVVVQSFSEQYALPGVHVSYCIAHPETIAEIERFYDNTGISMMPEALAEPSLSEHPKLEGVRSFLYGEIPWMQTMLSFIPGVEIQPAEANYVMCSYRSPGQADAPATVDELADALRREGLLIRKLEGTPGLGSSDYFCVAVRTRQQNEKLIAAIRSLMASVI